MVKCHLRHHIMLCVSLLFSSLTFVPNSALAQAKSSSATIPVPKCLIYVDSNTRAPCTGVVPVDTITGDALSWMDIFGSSTKGMTGQTAPTGAQLIGGKDGSGRIEPFLVDSAGILQVNCPTCGGSTGGSNAGGSNAAANAIGTTSPTYASYIGYLGSDNKLHGIAGDNTGHPGFYLSQPADVNILNYPNTQAISAAALPLPTNASTSSKQDIANTALATIANNQISALPSGDNKIGNVGDVRVHWSETTSPLGAKEVFTGLARDDTGSVNNSGLSTPWNTFGCFILSDQPGSAKILASNDNVTWMVVQTQPIVAQTSLFLVQPLFTKYWKCQVSNGNTSENSLIVNTVFGN